MGRIILVKSDCIEDWYMIEKAEHEHRTWWEDTGPNSVKMCDSARISDACVEGTGAEMLGIARGIKSRTRTEFKRCAVEFYYPISDEGPYAHFWSPRNSREEGVVSLAEADELADQIIEMLGGA